MPAYREEPEDLFGDWTAPPAKKEEESRIFDVMREAIEGTARRPSWMDLPPQDNRPINGGPPDLDYAAMFGD